MSEHTPGPWRWEYNAKHRNVSLVGGRPMHDLTVMDFSRWGMSNAVPRFRDISVDGMNIMEKLCDRPEWIGPIPGREHHKDWCQGITHPDAMLIAAAPEMLEALLAWEAMYRKGILSLAEGEYVRANELRMTAIAKATGEPRS